MSANQDPARPRPILPRGRWDADPLLVGQILGTLEAHLRAGAVEAESLDTPDAAPAQPFNDSATLALVHRSGSLSDPETCRHSWFRVSGADRWKCPHCGIIRTFSSEP